MLSCFAAVKLNSLVIKSSGTEGWGPRSIRLFKNTPSIGFGEAENAPAVQEFELTEKDLEGEALTLRSGHDSYAEYWNIFRAHLYCLISDACLCMQVCQVSVSYLTQHLRGQQSRRWGEHKNTENRHLWSKWWDNECCWHQESRRRGKEVITAAMVPSPVLSSAADHKMAHVCSQQQFCHQGTFPERLQLASSKIFVARWQLALGSKCCRWYSIFLITK